LEEPNYRSFEKNESRRFQNTPLAKRPDISRFLEHETADAMKPVFVYRRMHDDKDAVILARSSGRLVSLDKRYHDYIAVKYPGAVFFVANDWEIDAPNHGSLVHAKLDGQIVAGVMPLRGLDPAYTVDLIQTILLEAAVVRFFQIEYVAVGPSDRSSVPDPEPAVILVYPCFGETDF
jgi:hypothetical protein